jgi:hypothetical protein
MTPLVQPLNDDDGVDIIGDVHGEIEALRALLARLGCDVERGRSQRPIVFVGDLIDRGPDSVAVVDLVMHLVASGAAKMVLGNHEYNLFHDDRKEGHGWFYNDDKVDTWFDGVRDVPYESRCATAAERARFLAFFASLPIALESPTLRVVHAAWTPDAIECARQARDFIEFTSQKASCTRADFDLTGAPSIADLHEPRVPVAFHAGLADYNVAKQNGVPVKVLTSGPEQPISAGSMPKFLSGKWRMVERSPWWQTDDDPRAVVFGHYWRRRPGVAFDDKPDPFAPAPANAWFGRRNQAFCVDFSVGYRYRARHFRQDPTVKYGLAALRLPERVLVFDDRDDPMPTI